MSWKKLNNIMSIIIIIIGISYVINLNYSASQSIVLSSTGIGPTYFPNVLTAILLVLCGIVLIQNNKNKGGEGKVTIPNFRYLVFTLILTVLFIASWQFLGYFYLNVFVFLTILLTVYRKEFRFKQSFFVGACTSIITTGFLYLLFGKILIISF